MPDETHVVSRAQLPLDGSSLASGVLPENAHARLVLEGEVRFEYAGLTLDGAHADESGSLLQIEPGTWHVVSAMPEGHRYVLEPPGLLEGPVTVRLEVDALVDKFLLSPSEVRQNLQGELSVSLEQIVPVTPWWQSTPVLLSLGLLSLVVLAGVGTTLRRRILRRRAQDADVKALAKDLLETFSRLEALSKSAPSLALAGEQLPSLQRAANSLVETTLKLRERLRIAKIDALRETLAKLAEVQRTPREEAAYLASRQQMKLVEPLLTEERQVMERLERIQSSLHTLCVAWQALSSPAAGEGTEKAEALLESVEREVNAAVATQQELHRL